METKHIQKIEETDEAITVTFGKAPGEAKKEEIKAEETPEVEEENKEEPKEEEPKDEEPKEEPTKIESAYKMKNKKIKCSGCKNYLKSCSYSKTQNKLGESRRCKVCIKLSY